MDSEYPIKVPYGLADDVAEVLEDLAQLDVGEVTDHKANLLGSAQNMAVQLRQLIRAQTNCPKHEWLRMPVAMRERYFRDAEQFCKLCGDIK